jgi:hypothetical protein
MDNDNNIVLSMEASVNNNDEMVLSSEAPVSTNDTVPQVEASVNENSNTATSIETSVDEKNTAMPSEIPVNDENKIAPSTETQIDEKNTATPSEIPVNDENKIAPSTENQMGENNTVASTEALSTFKFPKPQFPINEENSESEDEDEDQHKFEYYDSGSSSEGDEEAVPFYNNPGLTLRGINVDANSDEAVVILVDKFTSFARPTHLKNGEPNIWTIGWQPIPGKKSEGFVYAVHPAGVTRITEVKSILDDEMSSGMSGMSPKRFFRLILDLFTEGHGILGESHSWLHGGYLGPRVWSMVDRKFATELEAIFRDFGLVDDLCQLGSLSIGELVDLRGDLKDLIEVLLYETNKNKNNNNNNNNNQPPAADESESDLESNDDDVLHSSVVGEDTGNSGDMDGIPPPPKTSESSHDKVESPASPKSDGTASVQLSQAATAAESSSVKKTKPCPKCKKDIILPAEISHACPRCHSAYCSAKCRKAHRGFHKKKCDRRAKLLERRDRLEDSLRRSRNAVEGDDDRLIANAEEYFCLKAHLNPLAVELEKEVGFTLPRYTNFYEVNQYTFPIK